VRLPSFRILGFPVTVMPGFLLGMLLVYVINGARFGLWLVVWLAILTLAHELGHALAARRFGADAAISLNFLVGYASLRPTRALKRVEQAMITAAGPLVEIGLGVAVLLVLGANPLDHASLVHDPLRLAVWWAGPVLGVVNLLPINPMDGGNLASLGLDVLTRGRGRLIVTYWSIALCAGGLYLVITDERWLGLMFIVVFLGLANVRELQMRHGRAQHTSGAATGLSALRVAANSEREAWERGRAGLFPPGWTPSPWFRASVARASGDDDRARGVLIDALGHGGGTWAAPEGASTAELGALAALLPPQPPVGDLHAGFVYMGVLHQVGQLRQAAEYGHRLYAAFPAPIVAAAIARSLALLGYPDDAMGWLRVATNGDANAQLLDHPDLASLRDRADFAALRARVSVGPSGPMSSAR
jgi:Zn-dependent protease